MDDRPTPERIRQRLRLVRRVALIDLVLLVALLAASLAGQRELVRVVGPLHGITFFLLLALAISAVLDRLWGWWYPALILLTAGPPGALIGDRIIERRLATGGGE